MYALIGVICFGIFCFSLIYTWLLGRSQKPSDNEQYDQSRLKNLLLLTLIYLICFAGGLYLLYEYVKL